MPRYSRSIVRTALLVCGVVAAAPLAAQQQSQQSEIQSWQLPGWTFTPSLAIGPMFDSNVAIAGVDVSGRTASDTLLEVEPAGLLEFNSARTSFSTGYRGSLRRYFELRGLDGVDHRLHARLRHRLNRRVTLFVDQAFQQVPTTDLLELNGLPFLRVGSRYHLLSGGVDARVSKALDFTSNYEFTSVDFHGAETPLSGGTVNGVHAALKHRFGERFAAGGEYGIRFADLNDGARQYTYHNAGAVLQYRSGEHTTLDISGGLTYFVDRTRDENRTGPYLKAGVTHRLERATVSANYSRSYTPSFALGGSHRSHELTGAVEMPLRRNRLYVQESASWRRTDPFFDDEPALDSTWLRSTLGYSLQRWLRLEGYYMFTRQNTRVAGGRITRQIAGVQVVIAEPVRIR